MLVVGCSTDDGQELYGDAYYDIDYFVGYHLTQASGITCDHMHDGMGFFTQVLGDLVVVVVEVQIEVSTALAIPFHLLSRLTIQWRWW